MLRWELREIMERQKLSVQDLAAQVQVHESRINRLKSSYIIPNIDEKLLEKLRAALDCPMFDLLEYELLMSSRITLIY